MVGATTPCVNPAAPPFLFAALVSYQDGGTLIDSANRPGGRGTGLGQWRFERNGQYQTRMRLPRQVDSEFDGFNDVTSTISLLGNNLYSAQIRVRVLNLDGSLRVELCGQTEGERFAADF